MNRFENRKAILIGGASGMARATAEVILREGGSAVLVGRDLKKLNDARTALAYLGNVVVIASDIADASSLASLRERIDRDHSDARYLVNAGPACLLPKPSSTTRSRTTIAIWT
jgi:NADP-dependent 3-hydroxy acid dehydrogenase YdfG